MIIVEVSREKEKADGCPIGKKKCHCAKFKNKKLGWCDGMKYLKREIEEVR